MYNRHGLYETGARFALGGWSADEWATFFAGVEQPAAQLYSTVAGKPVAPLPATVVSTPLGAVPSWLIPTAIVGGLLLLALPKRSR